MYACLVCRLYVFVMYLCMPMYVYFCCFAKHIFILFHTSFNVTEQDACNRPTATAT